MSKRLFLFLISIFMLITLQAQDRITVIDEKGVDTGLTQEEFEQFKKEYYIKMEKLGMFEPDNYLKSIGWKELGKEGKQWNFKKAIEWKINLNAVKEFKNEGIDIVNGIVYCFAHRAMSETQKIAETILRSDFIFVGQVTDSINIFDLEKNKTPFQSYYKIKPLEVLMGKDILPTEILIYSTRGNPNLSEYPALYTVGGTYIFMVDNRRYDGLPNDQNYFISPFAYNLNKTKEIKNLISIITKINDKKNFYKRRYK